VSARWLVSEPAWWSWGDVAFASTGPEPVVLTSDAHDLGALSEHTARPITIATV